MQGRERNILANRYVLQDPLQTGGMTTVYKARDLETDELVAVKRFDRDKHLPEIEREAFDREVDALRRLSHPNILRLLDCGEDSTGKIFVVLELMKHDLLAEREGDGAAFSGWDDFADLIVLPLLSALSYAHEVGIAHRDVKPANVLVGPDGTIKLADFGISKLKRTLQPRLTLNEFMSPPFSPPEFDSGDNTYARDVYSIGVLCLWALSEAPPSDHSSLSTAIGQFDAPPEVIELIRKTIATRPTDRLPSAALLATNIERIQAQRRQVWAREGRRRCAIGITNRAFLSASEELGTTRKEEITKYILEDINLDSCVERFVEKPGTMESRVRPGHYSVLGATFRYHLAESSIGEDCFVLINILRPEPHFVQRERENAAPSPIQFDCGSRTGALSKREALTLIERTIEEFEQRRRDSTHSEKETALFDTWSRVLSAQLQFEREQSKPLTFSASSVDGPFVTLTVSCELDGIELGEPRIVETQDGRFIRGEIWEVRPETIVLNCATQSLGDFPANGVAKFDLYAMRIAVDRQQEAINRIRKGTCVVPRLRSLILCPEKTADPQEDLDLAPEIAELLDDSKQAALRKALGTDDLLIVQGPPGTGKTQFIVALVLEELRRNSAARILLTSQTHIAIDNALERLGGKLAHDCILRIARQYSPNVQGSSEPFLIANQMKKWREAVKQQALRGLETWAQSHGLNPLDLRAGALVRRIAELRRRTDETRAAIHAEEDRKRGLREMQSMLPETLWELEVETAENQLAEMRDRLDIDKEELSATEENLCSVREDGAALLELSPDEQAEWAGVLLGDTPAGGTAESLIRLQNEWINRFGASRGFIRPLIERSSVTAATCVGVASIEDIDDVEFDLCIIDESSKATAMEASVPMARSKRWILVGDSKQLPPFRDEILARSDLRERFEILNDDASESMFERFRRLLPATCQAMLRKQYRMVEPIGRLVSDCFYSGELESVRTKVDPVLAGLTSRVVNWISTSGLPGRREQRAGSSFVNPEEAAIIAEVLLDLDARIAKSPNPRLVTTMILSGYSAQVNHLDRRIQNMRAQLRFLKAECCTIDRVQGREADVTLLSITRSNIVRAAGFLRELERVNVAMSRARELVLVVGDDSFIEQQSDVGGLQKVLTHIKTHPGECAILGLADYRSRRGPR